MLYRLNLDVPPGETTVLMGPSGVGKSTLIRHILGLLRPNGGTVSIDGHDVWSSTPRQWEKLYLNVGAMLGGSFLITGSTFGSLSALENLTLTLEALGVPPEQRHDRAVERLHELDLDEYQDHLPSQLSAHATKRLALARALVTDAPLVILDEIEVGLDKAHSQRIVNALRALRARTGCTLLLTTHNIELARLLADNLSILVQGRIVASGHPTELLTGIDSTEEFDHLFRLSGDIGPVSLGDALRAADVSRPATPTQPADRMMITIGVAAVIVIVVVLLILRVHLL